MLESKDTVGMVPPAVVAGLRKCLASRQAVSLELILQHQEGAGREMVMKALEGLVSLREVEVLCPVAVGAGGGRTLTFHPLEHYRLVRATDRDHVWQVHVTDAPDDCSRMVEREWQAASCMPERVSDFAWLLPWYRFAYRAG